jgi:nucleoside-diphosphate-sugar epimerase
MESVVITGANGFIGSNLCKYFLDRSYEVHAMVRPTSDLHFLEGLPVNVIQVDLSKPDSIRLPPRIDYIIHAASMVSDLASSKSVLRNIRDATVNLVTHLRDRGIALKRFIFISSTLVLGYGAREISEARPGRSAFFLPYTRAKRAAEEFLLEQHRETGFPVIILRPGDVFGPNDRTTSLKLLRAIEGGVPPIVSGGDWIFGFCYVSNLAQACLLACQMRGADGKAYSVTNGQDVTWRMFFTILLARLGKCQRIPVPAAPLYVAALFMRLLHAAIPSYEPMLSYYRISRITSHASYDICDAVKELGYAPDQDFERQVNSIVDWYLREKAMGYLDRSSGGR